MSERVTQTSGSGVEAVGDLADRLARLVVAYGANVQPGQLVAIQSGLEHHELTRRLAAWAYRGGARFVDLWYFDPHLRHVRMQEADPETLTFTPPWYAERLLTLARERGALVKVVGDAAPGLFEDVDPALLALDPLPDVPEWNEVTGERTLSWTIVPCPTPAWASKLYGAEEPDALARLWRELGHICRLDEPDPVAAWAQRVQELSDAAERVTRLKLDAVRFRGPGSDLTIGLMPTSRWVTADFRTVEGRRHFANIPSEEIFTTPDPTRAEGVVRITRPVVLGGATVSDLELRFAAGRLVDVSASAGAEVVRSYAARDAGASRLGEVALVDGRSRIGQLGTVFLNGLIDENAASHIALGHGAADRVDGADRERVNLSAIHEDVMIGGPGVDAFGLDATGSEIPLLIDGAWRV